MAALIQRGCIYAIINLVNKKAYIGSTTLSPHIRWNRKYNKHLENAFTKYGRFNFCFEILEWVENFQNNLLFFRNLLLKREQHYIDTFKPKYNISCVAGSTLGTKKSLASRNKIAAKIKGLKRSQETKTKIIKENK